MSKKKKMCPRCLIEELQEEDVQNSVSRRDNETYICVQCGKEEAFIDSGMQKDPFELRIDKMFVENINLRKQEVINEKLKEKLLRDQHEFLLKMQHEQSLNIVTCGNCGGVLIHHFDTDPITCPHCLYVGDQCDMPDLFY